ncbi:MAG: glucosaminidase domain-containing protein [Chitinophagaceae bacterium]
MKKILLVAIVVFSILTVTNAGNTGESYVDRYKRFAIELMTKSGIPASITLAIALVESGGGTSRICKKLNNHFGVRGRNSGIIRSTYKEYESVEAAYLDFIRMISVKKFYNKLKDSKDVSKWIAALSKSGYSEVPAVWSKKIFSTISQYNLTVYDKE